MQSVLRKKKSCLTLPALFACILNGRRLNTSLTVSFPQNAWGRSTVSVRETSGRTCDTTGDLKHHRDLDARVQGGASKGFFSGLAIYGRRMKTLGRSKLGRRRELALVALLESRDLKEAAEKVGVSEVTLWRWLRREDFRNAFRELKKEAVSLAISRIQQVCGEAVETLREVMTLGKGEAPRVQAAKAILELALKALEIEELEERIEALEKWVNERGDGGWD
jgi:predicted DNA-binding transcriptional regulator AlpA